MIRVIFHKVVDIERTGGDEESISQAVRVLLREAKDVDERLALFGIVCSTPVFRLPEMMETKNAYRASVRMEITATWKQWLKARRAGVAYKAYKPSFT